MTRTRKWQPILPENAGKPKPYDVITHPSTGANHFCVLPQIMVINGPTFPPGQVILFHGRHAGKNGFGIEHIWARHFTAIKRAEDATQQIAKFVALVLVSGTNVYYEFNQDRPHNLAVLRSADGLVGVEHRPNGSLGPHYSVVTAIPGKKNANGSLVGAVT